MVDEGDEIEGTVKDERNALAWNGMCCNIVLCGLWLTVREYASTCDRLNMLYYASSFFVRSMSPHVLSLSSECLSVLQHLLLIGAIASVQLNESSTFRDSTHHFYTFESSQDEIKQLTEIANSVRTTLVSTEIYVYVHTHM